MSELSSIPMPETLGVIAGLGSYPWQLARSAHAQGVKRVVAFAFKGETERVIAKHADEVVWMHLGSLQALLDAVRAKGVTKLVMAGQIKPTRLFSLRLDAKALAVLRTLKVRNAHTIFGAIGDELRAIGAELLPAYCFMETEMPAAGTLGRRAPDERELADIRLGAKVAKITSGLEIGQTVVVKEGTVLAVEGFEGTDETILRAGRLGGPGAVVVKVAKLGHDMRFDIPIVGLRTFKMLKKAKISCLAVEAKRTILLEREKLAAEADRLGIAFAAFDTAATEPV
ncbi:MAG TPA: UDP-2,3-diacylglucosamine diphosphatase LpxI [Kiritimatiellia bacterium]|nr:UDP-2,3-diacylglucosamine diphosphatase LpxI [Kiritimatiellia bacterium]